MYEDTTVDATGVAGGISRRDMLRKSAVVGGAGAMIWAAPSITKYGSAAFGSEGTPLTGFSYAAAVVNCVDGTADGTDYRVKYELDEGGFEDSPGNLPKCDKGDFATYFEECWLAAESHTVANLPFTIVASQSGDTLTFSLTSDNCTFTDCGGGQAGAIQGGTICDGGATISGDGKSISFDTSKVK